MHPYRPMIDFDFKREAFLFLIGVFSLSVFQDILMDVVLATATLLVARVLVYYLEKPAIRFIERQKTNINIKSRQMKKAWKEFKALFKGASYNTRFLIIAMGVILFFVGLATHAILY